MRWEEVRNRRRRAVGRLVVGCCRRLMVRMGNRGQRSRRCCSLVERAAEV